MKAEKAQNNKGLFLQFLFLLAIPAVVNAQFTFTTNNGSITITGYDGPGGAVIIPCAIDGYPVASINNGALSDLTGITSVTIPNSVTIVGNDAFEYCYDLTNVWIGNGVTNIGGNIFTFGGHSALGDNAFFGCTNLINITVDAQNPVYTSTNGVMFDKGQTTIVQYPVGLPGAYSIPEDVTNVGFEAFVTADLNCVTIPDSVKTISENAFEFCENLSSITIPNSVTVIGPSAFANCSSLTTVIIGSGITNIDGELTLFADFPSYAYGPFMQCVNLSGVYFEGNAPAASSASFQGDATTAYYLQGTTGWCAFATNADIPVALWLPQMQTVSAVSGAQANPFTFNINWASGQTVVVEACTNIFNPSWQPMQTNMLSSNSVCFSDPQWTNYPTRFYRIASQ